ncbi:MAG: hypothetical protein ABSG78_14215 [Verrucomicrobiota bacterium]|jgi:hypothetical protein
MKTQHTQKPFSSFARVAALLFLLAGAVAVRAQVLTNDFFTPVNYVFTGIIGDTNWDGVYLNSGDIPFGPGFSAAQREGNGASTTLAADTQNVPAPVNSGIGQVNSALRVSQSGGSYTGESDSYFFLWKAVSGDFSVSVRSLPPWQTTDDIMAGPLVRAYNTNQTGAPVSFNQVAQDENSFGNFRFDDFSLNDLRMESNGAVNYEFTTADADATGINSRMFRIDRIQLTNFYFYWATNLGDPWTPITSIGAGGLKVRSDLANDLVMQVGIGYSAYGTLSLAGGIEWFDSFQITPLTVAGGTPGNLLLPSQTGYPTVASGLAVTATDPSGKVTLSWTPGLNGDGSTANSMVIIRPNANIIAQPISGLPLPMADANLADVLLPNQNNAQYNASNNIVVYEGKGSSVQVSGLLSYLNNYTAAVFSYSNTSTNLVALTTNAVFNTAVGFSTATNVFPGPGTVTSVTVNVGPASIPVGGVGFAQVTAYFSTGGSAPLSSTTTGLTISSDTPGVIAVVGSTLQALSAGSASISVSLVTSGGTFTSPNVLVTTHNPAFTDNFTNAHDYVANGLAGTGWDGLFLNYGDNPTPGSSLANGTGGIGVPGSTQVMSVNTGVLSPQYYTNALNIQATAGSWGNFPAAGGGNPRGSDGPFLFKNVPGDFQCWVHVTNMSIINNDCVGLLARFFQPFGTAQAGGYAGPDGSLLENHLNLFKVQNGAVDSFAVFRFSTPETTDQGLWTPVQGTNGSGTVNTWLLMQRFQHTNFYFYAKSSATDNWGPIGYLYVDSTGDSLPLQVGIAQQMVTAGGGYDSLDNFNLDAAGITTSAGTDPTGLTNEPPQATSLAVTANVDQTLTYTWTAATNGTTPVASILVLRRAEPVNAAPVFGEGSILAAGPYLHPYGLASDNIGSSNYAVYRSADVPSSIYNTATIHGLANNTVYYAEVFTYDGTGAATLFNETGATAEVHVTASTGSPSGVEVGIPSIPVGGLSRMQVIVQFLPSTGTIDDSANTTSTSSDPTTIQVSGNLASGIKLGSAWVTNIVSVNGTPLTNAQLVTVRPPVYTDPFNVNHDYLQNGVAGTMWDGVYTNGAGMIPEQVTQGSTSVTTWCVATNTYLDEFLFNTNAAGVAVGGAGVGGPTTNDILLNNVLVVTNTGGGWEFTDDAFFLFKVVPGDFQAVVHLDDYSANIAYCEEGLMARAFSDATNAADATAVFGTSYAPFVYGTNADGSLNQAETWVSMNRFDEYNIGQYERQVVLGNVTESFTTSGSGPTVGNIPFSQVNCTSNGADGKGWLMIQRYQLTNFFFYGRTTSTAPWTMVQTEVAGTPFYVIPQVAGVPMQVGIADMSYNALCWAKFDSFMLDAAPTSISLVNNGNGTLTLSWPATPGFAHLYSSPTIPAKFTLVNGVTITTANGISAATVPISGIGDLYYEVGP